MTRKTRAALRLVGIAVGSLALVASLLLTSLLLWLQTASGRGFVGRALARQASDQLGLELSVGRISGNVISGIRLEGVTLRDEQGRLVARADVLSARYWLDRLIRHHEIDEIALVRPVIVRLPSRFGRAPPSRGPPATFSVRSLTVSDGSFRWHGHDLQLLSANAAIQQVEQGAHGHRVECEMRLVLDQQPLFVRANAELDGARVRLSVALQGAGFDARGSGDWADGRLSASLDELAVAESLMAATRPWAGRGPLHAHGTVQGPLDALHVELQGHTDSRAVTLGALVDVPRRNAYLTAAVAAEARSARARVLGALRGRTLYLTALDAHIGATRVTGAAHANASGVVATLDARVAPAEAALIRIHPVAPIQLRITLHGPARALDVRLHGELRAAQVALAGRIDLPARRGHVHFFADDIRVREIVPGAPVLAFSGAFTFDGGLRGQTSVEGKLSVTDGNLRVAGWRFERLQGTSRVRFAAAGVARVDSLVGELAGRRPRRIETQTTVRWDPRGVRCEASRVVLDENQATGEVVYGTDPITRQPLVTVNAQTLSLSPELIQEALHRRPPQAWPGHAQLLFAPNRIDLTFALETNEGPASGSAQIRRDRGMLELSNVVVALGESHFRGAARVKNGEIVASIDELLLQPGLVYSLLPPLHPALPLLIQGALAGPLHSLDLRLLATSGPSAVLVRGRVDLPARSFELLVALDNFQMARSRSSGRVTLELALRGRLVEGGVAGTIAMRHASGMIHGLPLDAARLHATLDGPRFNVDQILIGVPGAVFEGSGGGTYRDFRIRYGVVITNALALRKVPKSWRVMIGATQVVPGRTVVGSIRRRAGGKIEISHHTIPPPFRWLNLLYHVLRGHPLHFHAN